MKNRQSAFTLLEIMLVISIIVVLLGLAISQMGNPTGFAKGVAVKADIQAIGTQLKAYEAFAGFLPTTEQGLQALVTQPSTEPKPMRWAGPYFKQIPKDPWGSYYIYLNPGRKNPTGYDLYSAGPDRKADTADDDWGQ
jgi:general secretion pathway protein G